MSDTKTVVPAAASEHAANVVTITINDVSKPIHRGKQTVEDLKKLGGVPLADELEQLIKGTLTPLADDGRVIIKGEEIFVSHPKDSGSSHPVNSLCEGGRR
jgi:hypothetical protein